MEELQNFTALHTLNLSKLRSLLAGFNVSAGSMSKQQMIDRLESLRVSSPGASSQTFSPMTNVTKTEARSTPASTGRSRSPGRSSSKQSTPILTPVQAIRKPAMSSATPKSGRSKSPTRTPTSRVTPVIKTQDSKPTSQRASPMTVALSSPARRRGVSPGRSPVVAKRSPARVVIVSESSSEEEAEEEEVQSTRSNVDREEAIRREMEAEDMDVDDEQYDSFEEDNHEVKVEPSESEEEVVVVRRKARRKSDLPFLDQKQNRSLQWSWIFCLSFLVLLVAVLIGSGGWFWFVGRPFCTTDDNVIYCRPCPDHGTCVDGKLEKCSVGYVPSWFGSCKEDSSVLKLAAHVAHQTSVRLREVECGWITGSPGMNKTQLEELIPVFENNTWEALTSDVLSNFNVTQDKDSALFESGVSGFSLKCELWELWWKIYLYVIGAALLLFALWYLKRWYRQKQENKDLVKKLIPEVKDAVKNRAINTPEKPEIQPEHIRDELLSGFRKQRKKEIWDKVVPYIVEDSRIQISSTNVNGPQVDVWQWIGN